MERLAGICSLIFLVAGCLETPGASSDGDGGPDAGTGDTMWQSSLGASTAYLASTDDGPVVVAGFAGEVALGGELYTAQGSARDLLVAALDDQGKVLYAQRYGGEADEYPTAVAVRQVGGEIGVIGMYGSGEGELGGAPLPAPSNGYHLFAARYAPGPEHLSSIHGTATDGLFPSYVLSMSGAHELAFAGDYRSMMQLGGLSALDVGGRDLFIALFDAAGTPEALVGYADTGDQIGMGAVHDGLGRLFLIGTTTASFMVDEFGISGDEDGNLFVAQMEENGTDALWAIASVGGAVGDLRAAATPTGDLLLTGRFEGELSLGSHSASSRGGSDVFIALVQQDGSVGWLLQFGGIGDDAPAGLSVGPGGEFALTGEFRATATVSEVEQELSSAGGADIFLLVFDEGLALRRAHGFGGPDDDAGTSVAVGAGGAIVLAALYRGDVDFGLDDPLPGGDDPAAAVVGFR